VAIALSDVSSSGSLAIATGTGGAIISSPDGAAWSTETRITSSNLNAVTWNGARFVPVGAFGTILAGGDLPNLVITGIADPDPVEVDSPLDYVFTVTNPGVHSATGVMFSDTLPAGITYRSASVTSAVCSDSTPGACDISGLPLGICSLSSGTVSCNLGDIAVGSAVTVTVGVTAPQVGELSNTASVSANETESDLGDNTAIVTVLVGHADVISLTGSDSPDPVAEGFPLSYTFTITNSGDVASGVTATGVTLTDTLPDGTIFHSAATSTVSEELNDVIWTGSLYVVIGKNGTILTSTDGEVWTQRTSNVVNWLLGIAWNGSRFVAVGSGGAIVTSDDGLTWTVREFGTNGFLYDVIWAGDNFVAVGAPGAVLTSPDGITWTTHASGTTGRLRGITWSGSRFVAVGDSGIILTSPDGVTWASRASGTFNALLGVAWNGFRFVAVGDQGVVLGSADGVTWETERTTIRELLTDIVWNGTQFVVTADKGIIMISADGSLWSNLASGVFGRLEAVIWDGTRFIAVGVDGTIRSSSDGINWQNIAEPGTCAEFNGTVSCSLGDMTVGQSRIVTLVIDVTSAVQTTILPGAFIGTFNNTVSVTINEPEVNTGNNTVVISTAFNRGVLSKAGGGMNGLDLLFIALLGCLCEVYRKYAVAVRC
jgi:uncharacterized repeat protein (TIGR01451 family)